jgi:hypothetical protein
VSKLIESVDGGLSVRDKLVGFAGAQGIPI